MEKTICNALIRLMGNLQNNYTKVRVLCLCHLQIFPPSADIISRPVGFL